MVSPVRTRGAFAALSRSRDRRTSGPVWVVHVPGTEPAAVAYAINTRVGNAVVRNRIRRRLRAVMDDLDAGALLAPGLYLVGVRPAVVTTSFGDLRAHVARALPEPVSGAGQPGAGTPATAPGSGR